MQYPILGIGVHNFTTYREGGKRFTTHTCRWGSKEEFQRWFSTSCFSGVVQQLKTFKEKG